MDTTELVGARMDPWLVAALAGACAVTLVLGWTRWQARGRIVLLGVGGAALWLALAPEPRTDHAGVVDVVLRDGGGHVYDERTQCGDVPLGEPARLRLHSDRWRVVSFAGAIRILPPGEVRELHVVPRRVFEAPCKGRCPGALECIHERCREVFRDLTRPFSPPAADVAFTVEDDPPRGVSCHGFPPPVERAARAEFVWHGTGCTACHTDEEPLPSYAARPPEWLLASDEVEPSFPFAACEGSKFFPHVSDREAKLLLLHLGRLHRERTGAPPRVVGASVAWLTDAELATSPRD